MKKFAVYIASFLLLIFLSLLSYQLLSPKVTLKNLSNQEFSELIVQLPSSRVSIGPIEANADYRIYYSFQNAPGEVSYVLKSKKAPSHQSGTLQYSQSSELGRELEFIIDNNAKLSLVLKN